MIWHSTGGVDTSNILRRLQSSCLVFSTRPWSINLASLWILSGMPFQFTVVASVLSQPNLTATKALSDVPALVPVITGCYFAFARVKGDVCLVQVSSSMPISTFSALTTVDVKIFRHEFITIFRFSEARTLHPADISIIECIDDDHIRYEERHEMVFVARELIDRILKMTEKPSTPRVRLSRFGTRFTR